MYFLSILIKYGLIRRKVVRDEITTIIRNNQWTSFKTEYELVHISIIKSKVDVLAENKLRRRDISFVRIGNTNYHSYDKASKQYKSCYPHPVINACNISRLFFASIMDEISDSISWKEYSNNNNMEKSDVPNSKLKHISNFTTIIIDSLPLPSSKYPLLESLSMDTSDLEATQLRVAKLKNIMKEMTRVLEDNEISMNIESWSGRGKKQIIQITIFWSSTIRSIHAEFEM